MGMKGTKILLSCREVQGVIDMTKEIVLRSGGHGYCWDKLLMKSSR